MKPGPASLISWCRLAATAGAFTFSGCVSDRYKATETIAPPVALNLTAATADAGGPRFADVVLHHVIIFQGPGSWKRDAYWDEYVVSIINRSPSPLIVESATLTDFRGDAAAPGTDPWLLETQSQSRRDELNRTAKSALVQLGGGTLAASGTMLALVGGAIAPYAGAVAVPIYATGAILKNVHGRKDIEVEFARRRFVLPATVAPGRGAQGSLFFRIAPGPQSLALRYQVGGQTGETTIDLKPLSGLHLKSVPTSLPSSP